MRFALAVAVVLMLLAPISGAASAAPEGDPSAPNSEAAALCPLGLQLRHPGLCRFAGSRAELFNSARRGEYPERPLPLKPLDPALGNLPFRYLRSRRDDGTPLYTSLDDAFRGENAYRVVPPGFVFFSWIERYEKRNTVVYMIVPGVYIRGDGLSRVGGPSFRGLAFSRTPSQTFAWILTRTETQREPGYDSPATGRVVERFQVTWVYETRRVDGWDWYRIGPGEWIEQRRIAKVEPNAQRPEGVESDRWISVNLYAQTLTVYEGGELVYATLVSTGLKGWWTRPGVFQVYEKLEADPMEGSFEANRSDYYYLEDVPWILYFDESRALHGAYWHNGYGYPRSHGCVNLSPADAQWIYNWAEVGTYVHVYDPSGETPTDPSLYGAGGV